MWYTTVDGKVVVGRDGTGFLDASITGYQILRGPDVDSLEVIVEDANLDVGAYTDENSIPGQTRTYGIKARNASGLSPLSNTEDIFVPEVTTGLEVDGNVLVSTLGQTVAFEGAIVGTFGGSFYESGTSFATGSNPHGYHLTTMEISITVLAEDAPTPLISIRGDNAGVPGETDLYTFTTSSTIARSDTPFLFTTVDETVLKPNSRYWMYATTSASNMGLRQTTSEDEDAESRPGWQIDKPRYVRKNGGTWSIATGVPMSVIMKISGQAAPAFLVSNHESPSTRSLLNRQRAADRSKFAQAFSAANNENGTPAEFDFHGVTVRLGSVFSTPEQLADSDILVTVHKDSGDQPGDIVHTLTPTETYTVPLHIGPVTFSAPSGSTLTSGITYWVKFEIADASAFFTGSAAIDFEFATDNNEVQGPTVYNRWSIGDGSLWSPEALSWTTDTNSIKMTMLGNPRYATLVSNYGQVHGGAYSLGSQKRVAQSFMTPSTRPGQQYRLGNVRIGIGTDRVTPIAVDLYSDDGLGDGTIENHSSPDTLLASMFVPDGLITGTYRPIEDFVAVAPFNTLLSPETRYWIVVVNESEISGVLDVQVSVSTTESKVVDSVSLNGWTIGDHKLNGTDNPPSWQVVAFPLRMEIAGTPTLLRTDEADGPDLPGAGDDAHRGGAVVIPGITSTGDLTAGLDRNHGNTGDFWWLDTERGHSYRIQVKFGDGQRNNTGGSAWTYFIEGDRRGTCCESDHNRDDGFTFVHLKHGEDERDRRYLIDVAAFDKLNYSSRVYNGPYTITMTDITGTEKVATNLYLGDRADATSSAATSSTSVVVLNTIGDLVHHGQSFRWLQTRPNPHARAIHHGSLPELFLQTNASGAPGGILCNFLNPNKVQHHRPYAENPLPVLFLAELCEDEVLAPNTTYWIVLGGYDHIPSPILSHDQQTNGSGWTIGNNTAVKLVNDPWTSLGLVVPVEIWASKR